MKATVLAVANQKGGVGKTFLSFNVAAALHERGKRVLMADLDPQGSLTEYAGLDPASIETTVYQLLHGQIEATRAVMHPDGLPDLLPANIDLAGAELELAGAFEREYRLADGLAELRPAYDYVIIDCPPSLGLLTLNALVASNFVLIPVATHYSALRGVERLVKTVEAIRRRANTSLRILGIVPTMFDGRTLHAREVLEVLREKADSLKVFDPIPFTVRVQESPVAHQPIFRYAPGIKAAEAVLKLAGEVIS